MKHLVCVNALVHLYWMVEREASQLDEIPRERDVQSATNERNN